MTSASNWSQRGISVVELTAVFFVITFGSIVLISWAAAQLRAARYYDAGIQAQSLLDTLVEDVTNNCVTYLTRWDDVEPPAQPWDRQVRVSNREKTPSGNAPFYANNWFGDANVSEIHTAKDELLLQFLEVRGGGAPHTVAGGTLLNYGLSGFVGPYGVSMQVNWPDNGEGYSVSSSDPDPSIRRAVINLQLFVPNPGVNHSLAQEIGHLSDQELIEIFRADTVVPQISIDGSPLPGRTMIWRRRVGQGSLVGAHTYLSRSRAIGLEQHSLNNRIGALGFVDRNQAALATLAVQACQF